MRGKKVTWQLGFVKRFSQFLDIGGSIFHHIHNAVKKLCFPFIFLERFLHDLHAYSKFSAAIRQALEEICIILNYRYNNHPNAFLIGCYLLVTAL